MDVKAILGVAKKADNKANTALTGFEDYKQLVDSVIDEDITAVLNNAVVQTDIANKLNAKEAEYAPKLSKVNKALSLTDWELQNNSRKRQPLMTFIDDDGHNDVLTKIVPLSQTYNIPFTIAAVANRAEYNPDYPNYMNASDLLTLQNEHNFEICSHSFTHGYMDEMTAEQLEYELGESKRVFENVGLKINTFVYPYGRRNDLVVEIARKYYRCARSTEFGINYPPVESYDMRVVTDYPALTFQEMEQVIDEIYDKGGWGIFVTHAYNPESAVNTGLLEHAIQYTLSKNIEVVTYNEGMNRYGNILDAGRYWSNVPTKPHLAVGCDGSVSSSTLQDIVEMTETNAFTNTTQPSELKLGKIYKTRITAAGASGFPSTGILTTETVGANQLSGGYIQQIFQSSLDNTLVYTRRGIDENTWTGWQIVSGRVMELPVNTITTSTPLSGFPIGKITYCRITAGDRPEDGNGTLVTYRVTDNDNYTWQEYVRPLRHESYRRYWNGSVWSPWLRMTPLAVTTSTRNGLTIVNPGDLVFDTTLNKPIWRNASNDGWVDSSGESV